MTSKDRKVQIFLFCFYLLTGAYLGFRAGINIADGIGSGTLFHYSGLELPILNVTIGLIGSICSIITGFGLFMRVRWIYGFALFTSGLLFCYSIENIGSILESAPYEIIPLVLIILVILQSFPFLIKKSYRTL